MPSVRPTGRVSPRALPLATALAIVAAALMSCAPQAEEGASVSAPRTPVRSAATNADAWTMVRISDGLPVQVSSGALDGSRNWVTSATNGWMAFDLRSLSVDQRQRTLVAITSPQAAYYDPPAGEPLSAIARDLTIETSGSDDGQAPTSGWSTVGSISGNELSSPQLIVDLNGANWVRVNVSAVAPGGGLQMAADLHSVPNGADDDWLFLGDSITVLSLHGGRTLLPPLVTALDPSRTPAVINAAVGGTATDDALATIDALLAGFPGRYVVLGYGTNDYPPAYQMEALIQKVLSSGKVPVIPRIPWSNTTLAVQQGHEQLNATVDALLIKYPAARRGPDLHAAFYQRTDLLQADGVHPNDQGQQVWREQWAQAMVSMPPAANLTLVGIIPVDGLLPAVRLGASDG